jgi:SAM-dependent MidA family methyltransferase
MYFWFVLVGLLLLAFGLLFLLAELQNKDKSKKVKAENIKKQIPKLMENHSLDKCWQIEISK